MVPSVFTQLPVRPLGVETTIPPGNVSVNEMLLSVVAALGFATLAIWITFPAVT